MAELSEMDYQKISQVLAGRDITNVLLKVFEKTVKEEKRLLELALYHLISAWTPDPINLGLEAPTSEGKTYPIMEIVKRFPREDVWSLGGLSPTALAHGYGIFVDGKTNVPLAPRLERLHNTIDEVADEDVKKQIKREIRELESRGKLLIDLTGKIIVFLEAPSIDTFARLRPILSHDDIEVTYKFTDRKGSGPLQQITTCIRGWPVAVFFKATRTKQDRYFWDQISSRFTTVSPKMDAKKYREAVKFMAKKKGLPGVSFNKKIGAEVYPRAEKILLTIRKRLLGIKAKAVDKNIFWIPFQEKIGEEFPATVGRHMRDSQRFLVAMQMSAALNVFNRPIVEIDETENIIVVKRDYERAVELYFGEESATIFTGIPSHIINFFKKVIVPLWEENVEDLASTSAEDIKSRKGISEAIRERIPEEYKKRIPSQYNEGITIKDMVTKYREFFGKGISHETIRHNYLPLLANAGLLSQESNPHDKRSYLYLVQQKSVLPKNIQINPKKGILGIFTRENIERSLNSLKQLSNIKLQFGNKKLSFDEFWRNFYER